MRFRFIIVLIFIFLFTPFLCAQRNADMIDNQLYNEAMTKSGLVLMTDGDFFEQNSFQFKYQDRSLFNKVCRASVTTLGLNIFMATGLLLMPESASQWNVNQKLKPSVIKNQYQQSFTNPPVLDKDLWTINFIGHPYQGSIYYNSLRSQGASIFQSSLFNLGNIVVWEYVIEGGMERPSIQDLIVTPLIGGILGELTHRVAKKMKKNGYNFGEKVFISIINPSFAINNGFK